MRRYAGSTIADDMIMGGVPNAKARALLPVLPLKMLAAADLLTEARKKDPGALKIVNALKRARAGGENARIRLRNSKGRVIVLDAVTMERTAAVLNATQSDSGGRSGRNPGFLEWR